MRIGYFGDGTWAQKAFQKIIADDSLEIVFVVVRYDRQDIILMEMAKNNGIPLELCQNINSEQFIERVKQYRADIFVSMSFNQIFKNQIINIPSLKTINCHAGKLPFYRGRNILNWVLINDEKEFGVTVHYIDEGIDTGDIIIQRTYSISDEDNYCTLLDRAYIGCADALYTALKLIQNGTATTIKQADIDALGMYCGGREPGDEIIDWNQTSRDVFNFIRALCIPGPQAVSWINGQKICINRARMVPNAHVYKNITGQVIGKTEDGFFVKTADTVLEVVEYTYAGKIRIGDRLRDYE